jgi:hypothetical protein
MATPAEQVKEFARAFINGERTDERRAIIRAAYKHLTGLDLRRSCGTCYIEAIFKIINTMERKPCRYQLKKGAVLFAFGDANRTATDRNLTDELAEWHLRNTRGCAQFFITLPADAPKFGEPVKTENKAPNTGTVDEAAGTKPAKPNEHPPVLEVTATAGKAEVKKRSHKAKPKS